MKMALIQVLEKMDGVIHEGPVNKHDDQNEMVHSIGNNKQWEFDMNINDGCSMVKRA